MHAGITVPQWPSYVKEILNLLKPNGWAQLIELEFPYVQSYNGSLPADAAVSKVESQAPRSCS